jgi:hypothetical protein
LLKENLTLWKEEEEDGGNEIDDLWTNQVWCHHLLNFFQCWLNFFCI